MFKTIAIALIFFIVSLGAGATAQSPDRIIVGGEKYFLNTNPLEPYLKKIEWGVPEDAAVWSSNWRGYLALWEIKAGKLLLVDMTIEKKRDSSEEKRERKSILKTVFPNKNKVVAKWFNGALIVPDGEMVNYVHMGYGSTYEKYQILRIKSGTVVEHLHMSYPEFQTYQNEKFQAFRETEMFQKKFKNLTNGEYNWTEEEALNYMKSFYAEHYLSL